jgi:hypothetical protein
VRLALVCLTLVVGLSGVLVLGGATIASQATALSSTIKSQLTNVKSFLDKNGVDTSYLEFGQGEAPTESAGPAGSCSAWCSVSGVWRSRFLWSRSPR